MRHALAFALAFAFAAPAYADSTFGARAARFYDSIRERPSEFNCFPRICRAKAAALGLRFEESTFRVCDKIDSQECAAPRF